MGNQPTMKLLFSLAALFGASLGLSLGRLKDLDGILSDDELDIYNKYINAHGKACGHHGVDCKGRKTNFAENLKKYNEYKRVSSFKVNMHPWMDLSDDELKGRLIPKDFVDPLKRNAKKLPTKLRSKRSIPATFDWRTTGAVNPIRDQGGCGDCWAFASTATVEILDNLVNCRTNDSTRLSFSDQYVTDCTYYNASLASNQQQNGCNGGGGDSALNYIVANGIPLQSTSPFISNASSPYTSGTCKSTYSPKYNPIKDQWDLTGDVAGIMNYVATVAPVVAGIMICSDFYHYGGDIYVNTSCTEATYEGLHAVAIIGYGTDNGMDYWLVRNQWSTSWGIAGYGKIQRGVNMINIEKQGLNAPVPTTPASKCTTATTPYPNCQCTAPKTTSPASPFTVQSVAGQSGCIPSKVPLNCSGSGLDVVAVNLYDDNGNHIGDQIGWCYSKAYKDAPVATCGSTPTGSSVNYATYQGSRVAYAVCKNYGPQDPSMGWGCDATTPTTTTAKVTTTVATTTVKATTTTTKATTSGSATACQKCAQNMPTKNGQYASYPLGTPAFNYRIDPTNENCLIADWLCAVPGYNTAMFQVYSPAATYATQLLDYNNNIGVAPVGYNDSTTHAKYKPFVCNSASQWTYTGVADFAFECFAYN